MMANAAAALSASFEQLNHEIFCCQLYFAIIELLPQKLGLHASVRCNPCSSINSVTSSDLCCTIRISCVGYARHCQPQLRGTSSVHSIARSALEAVKKTQCVLTVDWLACYCGHALALRVTIDSSRTRPAAFKLV